MGRSRVVQVSRPWLLVIIPPSSGHRMPGPWPASASAANRPGGRRPAASRAGPSPRSARRHWCRRWSAPAARPSSSQPTGCAGRRLVGTAPTVAAVAAATASGMMPAQKGRVRTCQPAATGGRPTRHRPAKHGQYPQGTRRHARPPARPGPGTARVTALARCCAPLSPRHRYPPQRRGSCASVTGLRPGSVTDQEPA